MKELFEKNSSHSLKCVGCQAVILNMHAPHYKYPKATQKCRPVIWSCEELAPPRAGLSMAVWAECQTDFSCHLALWQKQRACLGYNLHSCPCPPILQSACW